VNRTVVDTAVDDDHGWKARPDGSDYDAVRGRLVDAAESLVREHGVAALRQEAVAERAGLSRSSVYRYFDSKDELVVAAVVQSTLRIGQQVIAGIGPDAGPEEFLVRGIVDSIRAMAADPLHQSLTTPASTTRMSRLTNTALREGVRPLVDPVFDAATARGALRSDVSRDDVVNWLQVVALGLMQSPGLAADTDEVEALLRKMLVPAVVRD